MHTFPGRRTFLQNLAISGALFGAFRKPAGAQDTKPAATDVDLLNFALNLEYLQAELYTYATTGKGIFDLLGGAGAGLTNTTTGGKAVAFTDSAVQSAAVEAAAIEQAHVSLLRTTLTAMGATPVAIPAINLNALGIGFASQSDFLVLARMFEDVGVTAYNGVLSLMQGNSALAVVARILSAEAQHATSFRSFIKQGGISTMPLDGVDILPPPSGSALFSTNTFGLTSVRAPGEVLALLYGADNAAQGSFFPSGASGVINRSTTPAPNDPAIRNQSPFSFTANPNPIVSATGHGVTTLSWIAPGVEAVELRVGTMDGGLVARGGSSGQVKTGDWVVDGMIFYLQDVSGGKGLFPAYTIGKVTVHVQRS